MTSENRLLYGGTTRARLEAEVDSKTRDIRFRNTERFVASLLQ